LPIHLAPTAVNPELVAGRPAADCELVAGEAGVSVISQTQPSSQLDDLDTAAEAYAAALRGATAERRESLRGEIICRLLPFAGRIARRYMGRGEPPDDLQQVARIGLINAVDRYDPARGSFTAFAIATISGEIKRHFRDRTCAVRVARRVQDLSREIQRASPALAVDLCHEPTTAQIADYLGVNAADVRYAMACSINHRPLSFSIPVRTCGTLELGETLGEVDPVLDTLPDRLALHDLIRTLPPRIQHMVMLRFYGNKTQTQIADELGISQMHVSRLIARGIAWLRAALLSDAVPPWDGEVDQAHPSEIQMQTVLLPGRRHVVHVTGEIDRYCTDQLRLGLHTAVAAASGGQLVIDLSAVPIVDVGAVAVLRDACVAASLARVAVTVTGMQPDVARIVAAVGLPRTA
jgi:RNA polymerase sigma-B factor